MEELLQYCYTHKKQFMLDHDWWSEESFKELIDMVKDGTLSTRDHLSKYGMDY